MNPNLQPVFFTDLDDTLFQTKRKMQDELNMTAVTAAALDRSLLPRSFMSEEQTNFVNWLFEHADVIPVTARGTEEIGRVQLPFSSWRVTTHGAVILNVDGSVNADWQSRILADIAPYYDRLITLQKEIENRMAQCDLNAWVRINYEYGDVPIYFVMKHRDSTKIDELYRFADEIEAELGTEGFYIHRNSNNIAWIPLPIEKGHAVRWLIEHLRKERGYFPIIGMGDSLSDYSFMKLCTWFAMPQKSQFTEAINHKVFGE